MTTLLQEFEEWLKEHEHEYSDDYWAGAIHDARVKLEELKKKYNVTGSKT